MLKAMMIITMVSGATYEVVAHDGTMYGTKFTC